MDEEFVSLDEALEQGLTRFFDGRPCKNGHVAPVYVLSGQCVVCDRERQRANPWHKRNPDRHREHNRRWDAANREKKREYQRKNRERLKEYHKAKYQATPIEVRRARARAWYEKNRETAVERTRQWLQDNPDRAKARKREYYKANKEAIDTKNKAWAEANPERVKANMAVRKNRRRVRENGAEGTFTASEARALLAAQNHRCAYCRADLRKVKKHLDHRVPLSRGGRNDKGNLIWACMSCNLSKGARSEIEFAQQMGRLL